MAMANKPPDPTTKQTFYITLHALDRMRTRSEAAAHLSDAALIRILDDAIVAATEDLANIQDVTDSSGDPAQLVFINKESLNTLVVDGKVYALIKDNERKDSQYKKAVITVLSESMVKKHYTFRGNGKALNSAMADQLKDVTPHVPGPVVHDDSPETGEFVPPCPQKVEELGYLVLDHMMQDEIPEVTREKARELARSDPHVRIYRFVPFTVSVELGD